MPKPLHLRSLNLVRGRGKKKGGDTETGGGKKERERLDSAAWQSES